MPELYRTENIQPKGEAKEVGLWQERISISKKSQEQWAEDSGAKRFIKEYKGDYGIVFHARNRKVPVPPINEVFSYVQADISTTYNRDPYITVNAEAGTVKGAALWEVILNYWWRKLKIKEEIEHEIIDKDLIGYAWHKVGNTVYSSGKNDQLKVDESLYSRWLDWKDVVWNIGSKRPPYDCQWMAHRIVEPLSKIKEKYPSAKGLEGVPNPDIDDESYKKASYKDDIKVGVKWEIWDAEKKQILLIADGLKDRFLEDPKPWPPYLNEFPFLMYWDFAIPGCSRPMSAIAPWEAQILEEMVLMGNAINHAKRWNRQAFVKNGSIDENALDKFERGDDGAIIVYNGDTADIKFADFGPLPTDFYLLMDRLQSIKRNINGQPEFTRGGVTKTSTRTIGELELISQGSKSRQDRKIDRLETHCENIARLMMACLKDQFDFDQTLKITGELPDNIIKALGSNYNPETGIVSFSPEEIQGEYDFDIKSGSTLPLDKSNRLRVLEIVLQTVAQVAKEGSVSPFLNALIQQLLKDYDIKGLQEAYQLELEQSERIREESQGQQSLTDQKVLAEAAKREAQTEQIHMETLEKSQEVALGPVGRAQLEKLNGSVK